MRLAHPTRFDRVASSFGGQRREMVRVVGIEPTLLAEPDFEGSRVYRRRRRCCGPQIIRMNFSPCRETIIIQH